MVDWNTLTEEVRLHSPLSNRKYLLATEPIAMSPQRYRAYRPLPISGFHPTIRRSREFIFAIIHRHIIRCYILFFRLYTVSEEKYSLICFTFTCILNIYSISFCYSSFAPPRTTSFFSFFISWSVRSLACLLAWSTKNFDISGVMHYA